MTDDKTQYGLKRPQQKTIANFLKQILVHVKQTNFVKHFGMLKKVIYK